MTTHTFKQATEESCRNNGGYASESLRAELAEHTDAAAYPVVNLAYTDYGGDFFDKVAIAYLLKNHPDSIVKEFTGWNGENAFVFGPIAEEFTEAFEKYPLGFGDIEEFYTAAEMDAYAEAFTAFVADELDKHDFDAEAVRQWLIDNKEMQCHITTQGVDYCTSDWVDGLTADGLITPKRED